MAEKNIQMRERNAANTDWDDLYPKTKAENVIETTTKKFVSETQIPTNNKLIGTLSSAPIEFIAAGDRSYKNHFAFLESQYVTCEVSTDGEATWSPHPYTSNVFARTGGISIPANSVVRLTITPREYVWLNMLCFGGSSTSGLSVKIDTMLGNSSAWGTYTPYTAAAGGIEPGIFTLKHGAIPFHTISTNWTYKAIRLFFKNHSTASSIPIENIQWFGPFPIGRVKYIYDYDNSKNVIFPANVHAAAFRGTSLVSPNYPNPIPIADIGEMMNDFYSSQDASGTVYNTGKWWFGGYPIKRVDFLISVQRGSTEWNNKQISMQSICPEAYDKCILDTVIRCNYTSVPTDNKVWVNGIDTIDLQVDETTVEWDFEPLSGYDELVFWGHIEYVNTQTMARTQVTHTFAIYNNLITNGNFTNGASGWTIKDSNLASVSLDTSISVSSPQSLKISMSTSPGGYNIQEYTYAYISGHKYYISGWCRNSNESMNSLGLRVYSGTVIKFNLDAQKTGLNEWKLVSGIYTADGTETSLALRASMLEGYMGNAWLDDVSMIDITSLPAEQQTKAWCDANIVPHIVY